MKIGSLFLTVCFLTVMASKMGNAIGDGIKQAMEHCSEQFKWNQWNCPKSAFSRRTTQKLKLTRELAFARALTSAGITHAVSKRCARSGRGQCECEKVSNFLMSEMDKYESKSPSGKQKSFFQELATTKDAEIGDDETEDAVNEVDTGNEDVSWSWGGCSDDPGIAEKTTQALFAEFEQGNDAYAFIEKQNNLVGQRVVKDSMVRACRCHGLSGSCSHQTCWMEVAPFEEIAENLKKRYRKAARLSYGSWRLGNAADMTEKRSRRIKPKQLVFLDESPDYCIADEATGWPGTLGRQCVRDNSTDTDARKSCQNLCKNCGYNLRREVTIKKKKCNCTFKMCCEVVCEICDKETEELFCA